VPSADEITWLRDNSPAWRLLRADNAPLVLSFLHGVFVATELLDALLDPSRVCATAPDFAGRYGFLRRPGYVRFRVAGAFRGFTELSVRTSEFPDAPDGITHAYVIENEITYLSFPLPAGSMAIFGGGYAVPLLEPLGWLTEPSPAAPLDHLDQAESALYADLIADAYGPQVRLEQERIRFSVVESALERSCGLERQDAGSGACPDGTA
jgi:hypothetical protein